MQTVEFQNSMNIFIMKRKFEMKSLDANGYKTNNEHRALHHSGRIKEDIYGIRLFGM